MWTFRQTRNLLQNDINRLYKHIDEDIQIGQFKYALKALLNLQKRYPQDARWMTRLGIIYQAQQQSCLAYHWYLNAAEKNDSEAFYYLGQIESKRHNFKLAEHYLQQAAKKDHAKAFLLLGELHFHLCRYQTAIHYLEHAYEKQCVEALIPLSRIYLLLKNFSHAKNVLELAFEHDLTYASHYLGIYYQNLHRFPEAKDWFTYSFQIEKNLNSLENLGQIFCAEGQIQHGEAIIELARKLEIQATLSCHENKILHKILGYFGQYKISTDE